MAEIYKKLDLEPAECQEALETAVERTLNSQQNRVSLDQAKINARIEAEVDAEFALPSSKDISMEQTLKVLDNADKKVKEEYQNELIARHYGIKTNKKTIKELVPSTLEEITRNTESELNKYFKSVESYITDKKGKKNTLNDPAIIKNLDYLANIAVLDETEVEIYKSALEKIDKLFGSSKIRDPYEYSVINHLKWAKRFIAISGTLCTTSIATAYIGAGFGIHPLDVIAFASFMVFSVFTGVAGGNLGWAYSRSETSHNLSSLKEDIGYKLTVANHIQKHGKTIDLDLEVAMQYGQKLQDSLKKIDCLSKEGQENIIEVQERIRVADEYLSTAIPKLREISNIDNPKTSEEK